MSRSSVKRWIAAAVTVALAAGGYAWYRLKPADVADGFVSANGRIEATEIHVAAKLGGRVVDIFAAEGDFVKAGQVLVQMQVDGLEAQRDEARAQHDRALHAVASAEAQVAVRESEFQMAEAVVRQRESELEAATRRLTRSRTLSREGAVSLQQYDDHRAAFKSAQAALAAAKAQATAARSAIDAAKAQVVSARSGVTATAATIARIETDIADSRLTAPRDGRIMYRVAQPGEVVATGAPVLNLVDLKDVYMTFFLPTRAAGRLYLGTEARIVLDAAPQYVIPAKVSFVADVAQFTPKTVETKIEREKLMFRVRAHIAPELLEKHILKVKTGLPGVAWIRLDPQAKWPEHLMVNVPE